MMRHMTVTGLKALLDMHNHEDELWIGNPKLPRKELESQVEKILTENPDAIHKLDYRESFFKAKYQTKYRLLLRKAKITQRRTRKSRSSTVDTTVNVANTGKTFPEWQHHENGLTKMGSTINTLIQAPCSNESIRDDKKLLNEVFTNDIIRDEKRSGVSKGNLNVHSAVKLESTDMIMGSVSDQTIHQHHASSPIMVASRGILEGHGYDECNRSDYTQGGRRGNERKLYNSRIDESNHLVEPTTTTVPLITEAPGVDHNSIPTTNTRVCTTASQNEYCPSMELTDVTVTTYPTCGQLASSLFSSNILSQLPIESEVPFPCGVEFGTPENDPLRSASSFLGGYQSVSTHTYGEQPVLEASDWFGSTIMFCGDECNDWNYNTSASDGWNHNI